VRPVIDLHLHTTASDGVLSPADLVARAAAAGITVLSVTDHDTLAGLPAAREAAARLGLRLVPGIEITGVERDRDVHILGYFFDPGHAGFAAFLRDQRSDRVRRVREMLVRLAVLGMPVDMHDSLERAVSGGASIGRPAIADALVAGGHAIDRNDAFARLLGRGRPAFVARRGAHGADVIRVIHEAGGLASLAHPVLLDDDALIGALAGAGLDAIEVWHSSHLPAHEAHYAALADRWRLERTGGSDFHGEGVHRACRLGAVGLPPADFARLELRAGARG
jgi:predicted metal-dependent phosphoesterase TrpH